MLRGLLALLRWALDSYWQESDSSLLKIAVDNRTLVK